MAQTARSPRLARRLLAACVPPEEREAVLGDLEEELQARAGHPVLDRLWYWRQVLVIGLPLLTSD